MAKLAKEEDKSDDDTNITCFPSITDVNANVGASPPLPVKLERNLACIKFLVGSKNNKVVPLTALCCLIESGAGAIIGFPNYFEVVEMLNTDTLVRIFTSCGGKYISPYSCMVLFILRLMVLLPLN